LLITKKALRHILSPVCVMLFAASALAASVKGTITDRTTGKPSAGDTVGVINTAQGTDEIAKATSDAQGSFEVVIPDGGQILLHITHKGAEYFKSLAPGAASVDIDVFDAAVKVDGISGEALVLRAETDPTGKTLSVAENFFVQNASAPPRTEYGTNTLDFYLPKGASISETLASGPGGLPTTTKIKTIDAATGHYAFTFPIRPGENRFQVDYTLPYNGTQPFAVKLSIPTGDVAVMLPKSMQFQPTSQFQPISPDANAQSYDAHQPPFAQPVQFTIAGTGQLPQAEQDTQGAAADQAGSSGQPAQAASPESRPGGGLGPPIDAKDENDPWGKYKWWILSALGLALITGAGIMLGRSPSVAVPLPQAEAGTSGAVSAGGYTPASVAVSASGQSQLMEALKDELLELETDRISGRLSAAQYAEHKAAFDVVLRRALSRIESGPSASNG